MDRIEDVISLVKRLDSEQNDSLREERRAEGRYPMVTPVQVQPIGDGYQPIGDSFVAVSREISRSGMSFVCSEAEDSPFLAVRLEPQGAEPIRVVMRVIRRVPLGSEYFEVGGEFVERL